MTDGILTLLRAGTSEAHTRLEQLVDIPSRTSNPERYAGLIECFFGWYEPMERSIAAAGDWASTDYSPGKRSKLSWLENDLRALGRSSEEIAALPRCSALPHVTNLAHGFGCAYVLEGATLGGRVITGMLQGHVPETARRFFRAYGEATRERWLQFIAALEKFSVAHGREDQTVTAAKEAFESLEAWLKRSDEGRARAE